jgi:hypothetical protein
VKQLFFIIAVSAILLQNFSKAIILLNYEINKEYISKNLCENKDKPMLHCDGHCHLKKQLDKEDRNEQLPFQKMNDRLEVQFCDEFKPFDFTPGAAVIKMDFTYSFTDSELSASPVFQPPRA